jgi:glycosyltransferase involved in cell wall biosynthesis
MRVLTLATAATLPQARVLARSLQRHEPDWPVDLVLVGDADTPVAELEADGSLRVRSAAAILQVDLERLIARHDEEDLRVLLVPRLLQAYLRELSEPLLHLPPSAWVIDRLSPVEELLALRGVVLTPRMTADVADDGLEPSPGQAAQTGRVDETIIAVDAGARAEGFVDWWSARTDAAIGSLDGRGGDRPEDRPWLARYLELAPARFSTAVLDDPGFNLSMWNLHRHALSEVGGRILVDGTWPARLLNLPGYAPDRPHRLAPGASRVRISRSPVLRELSLRYAAALSGAGWRDADHRRDIGRRLAEGTIYDDSLRALHARARVLGERFGDLFSQSGSAAFTAWLLGPAPEGAVYGINRYLFFRIARERPDVLRAYPDLDGADGTGYVAWCWAFGRRELAIPDRFMPPPPGRAPTAPLHPEPPVQAPAEQTPPTAARPRASRASATTPARAPALASFEANGARGADGSEFAVRVTGYLGHTLGLGSAARAYVQALTAAGVPVSTLSVPLDHLALPSTLDGGYGRHVFEDLVHKGRHGFEIVAVNADELPDFVGRLGPSYFEGPRIGIWGWETNSIPARWQRAFELVDEIWVYSRFMAENIGAVAPVPVVALAPPVQAPGESVPAQRLGVPGGFLFLFVFDYLSTIQRKNPVGLIDAFKRAFAPGEGPQLLIKTINGPLRPLAEEEVLWAAHGRPDIHAVDRSLSREELGGLMAECDCYASLHRAEGFGLTMAEAMAIGKPVIATGYSGNVDFMDSENSYLVDHTIGRVGPECEIYPPDGEWAEPSVEHAAELMWRVYADRAEASRVGARAAADIARTLSPRTTGAAMRRRLEELTAAS